METNNNSPQIVQYIVDKKEKLLFSYMLFAFRNFLLIAKKSRSSFEDEITNEVNDTFPFLQHLHQIEFRIQNILSFESR